jgi:hypothetical protein
MLWGYRTTAAECAAQCLVSCGSELLVVVSRCRIGGADPDDLVSRRQAGSMCALTANDETDTPTTTSVLSATTSISTALPSLVVAYGAARICGHDLILSSVPFCCWSAGQGVGRRVRRARFCDTVSAAPRPTIESAIPPAVPMPASPQSNPPGAATRTITGGGLTEWLGLVACMLAAPAGT